MTTPNHKERAHARLSASSASRWLVCTPSVVENDAFPDDRTSEFAEEGTAAHEYSEIFLQHEAGDITQRQKTRRVNLFKKENKYYSEEMEEAVARYVTLVTERISEARARDPHATVKIEERLDFSRWVPEGFGTGDVLIISEGNIEVIDLKYGKGIPVSAIDNVQLRLYGLGAYDRYDMLHDFETVSLTIVQPRLDSITTDVLQADELVAWGDNEVKHLAKQAWEGKGEYVPGDHCQFCKVKATCLKRMEESFGLYEEHSKTTLSVEDIAKLLPELKNVQKWAKDVEDYALDQAVNHGVEFGGHKLVEGRSNRRYSDVESIMETLDQHEIEPETYLKPKELKTITALEKELGKAKFTELLSEYIVKPQGKPVLVKDSDKRPALSSTARAEDDFKDLI